MAKKKVVTTEVVEEPNEVIDTDALASIPDDDPLAEIESAFPSTARRIKVSRVATNGTTTHLFSTTEIIDEDFLQENYGGGTYRLRVFIEGVLKRTIDVRVEGKISGDARVDTSIQDGKPSTQNQENSMTGFLQQLVLTLAKGGGATATPVNELAEAMKTIHGMNGGGNNSAQSYAEGLKAGVELAKGLQVSGDGDWKSMLFDSLKTVVPHVASAIASTRQPSPQVQEQVNKIANSDNPNWIDENNKLVYNAIQKVKPYCLSGASPDMVVEFVAANANNAEYQNIIHKVFNAGFEEFAKIDPEIANEPYASWFKQIFDGLRSAFTPDDQMDDNPGGDSGNGSNTKSDASTGNRGRKNGTNTKANPVP